MKSRTWPKVFSDGSDPMVEFLDLMKNGDLLGSAEGKCGVMARPRQKGGETFAIRHRNVLSEGCETADR
jgi:hypothetical protein